MKRVSLAILALAFALAAHADTLKFISTGSNIAGGVSAYPYYFSINNSATLTPLMCLSYDNTISTGESWKATVSSLTSFSVATTQKNEEAAWLLLNAQENPGNADNDQLAAWSLFSSDVPMDAGATAQLSLAAAGYKSIIPADFVIYTPVDGTQSSGGIPQTFIGDSVNVTKTPEPYSLILLGTGLAGLAFLKRREHAVKVIS
jgi:hypothetical protein